MRQNILLVILLLSAFLVLNVAFGGTIYQGPENDPVLAKEPNQNAISIDSTDPPAPRIMYRDIINQLSDSIVILNKNLAEINLRLEKTLLEKESLGLELMEATDPIDEPKVEKEKSSFLGIKIEPQLKTVLFFLFLGVVFFVKALLLVACRGAVIKAKKKNLQYDELAEEFENYRKASRERFEKQSIDHFNELKKLGKM